MNIFYNTSQHKSDKCLNDSFIAPGTEMFLFFNMMMKQISIYFITFVPLFKDF